MCRLFDHIPTACPLCRQRARGARLCCACLEDLDAVERALPGPRCQGCGLAPLAPGVPCWDCLRTPPPVGRVVVAMPYDWPYDQLMTQLKAGRSLWMARTFGHLLARTVRAAGIDTRPLVVPVPSSRASMLRRGFNPAGEIARAAAARLGLPVCASAVYRLRQEAKQSGLGRRARMRAAAGAFAAGTRVQGRPVALVDDVMTTGATVQAIAHALRQAGATTVTVWVVARRAR